MKKTMAIALTALVCLASACSDDDDNRCREGFSKCDGVTLLTCSPDHRIKKEKCNGKCIQNDNKAYCEGSGHGLPCGSVTNTGECDGNTVKWCENGELKTEACLDGKVCGMDESQGFFACINHGGKPGPGPQQGCGDIDGHGVCKDNVITYCADGQQLATLNCTKNEVCERDENQDYICFKSKKQEAASCGNVDTVGKCDGQKVIYCENNILWSITCNDNEMCGKDDNKFYNCVAKGDNPGPQNNCGNIDEAGVCDGNTAKWCENGELKTDVCKAPKTCGFDKEHNYYACIEGGDKPGPQNNCGDVDAKGKCEDNKAIRCIDGELKTLVCKSDETCGYNQKDGHADCFPDTKPEPDACGDVDAKGKCDGNKAIYCDAKKLKTDECGEGFKCGLDTSGNNRCVKDATPADEYETGKDCGKAVTGDGLCFADNAKLVYCENKKQVVEDCGDAGCIVISEGSNKFAQCKVACGLVPANGVCKNDKSGYDFCDNEYGLRSVNCSNGTSCQMVDNKAVCQ